MPVASTEIKFRLSGGAANSSHIASLGGAKSSVAITGSALFDSVGGGEAAAGDVEYRCGYVQNDSASPMTNAVLWITANTPSGSTTIELGLGTSAMNGTEQTVANEGTAPTGVTFAPCATKATGLALGTIPAGQHRAFWLRRTVTAGAAAAATDTANLRVECEA